MIIVDENVWSPIGTLTLAAREGRVCLVHFGSNPLQIDTWLDRWYSKESRARADLFDARAALQRYFEGEYASIDAVDVELNGTPFQRKVWAALRAIPPGTTMSYADLARHIGEPRAVRAVGAANGANPVAVIVPCHRVIGADGSLTGYGGGLERKRALLGLEKRRASSSIPTLFD